MKKLIKVLDKHIKKGKRSDPFGCPIFHACKDAGLDVQGVGDITGIWLGGDSKIRIPRSVQRFILRFDNKGKNHVKPFNFYLDI